MKPTRTWILIADRAHARILQNAGPGKGLQALEAAYGTATMLLPTNS